MSAESLSVQAPRIVAVADAVEELWAAVLADDYPNLSDAVEAMASSFRFKSDEKDYLLRRGLYQVAQKAQSSGSQRGRRGAAPVKAIGWGEPAKKEWARYVALTWPYLGADGAQKPLIRFTRADVAAFASGARKRSLTFARHAAFGGRVLVMELPPVVLARVEADALETLGGKGSE